jgi:hypothetical protein
MAHNVFTPVVCHTLEEIKEAIKPFMRGGNNISISCNMDGQLVNAVSSDSSPRTILLNGLDIIKKRMEMEEKLVGHDTNLRAWDVNNLRFSVDSIITKRLGGTRKGLRIRWKIRDGVYEYDPYSNKLYEVEKE